MYNPLQLIVVSVVGNASIKAVARVVQLIDLAVYHAMWNPPYMML